VTKRNLLGNKFPLKTFSNALKRVSTIQNSMKKEKTLNGKAKDKTLSLIVKKKQM